MDMKNADMPAMPFTSKPEYQYQDCGLTKREHFAAMAMQGFLSNSWQAQSLDELGESSAQQMQAVAEISLAMADALLSQLEK
jgi:hypothetical protein